MARFTTRNLHITHWSLIILSGAVWGAGFCRVLVQHFFLPLLFGISGTLLCSVLGALGAALIAVKVIKGESNSSDAALLLSPFYLPLVDIISANPLPWRGPVLLIASLCLVILKRKELGHKMGFWLSLFIPLIVYLPDISPYVGRADTFEFQVIAPQLGIAHPSGYPLYTLIGKLFSLLPFGSPAWKVNFSSAFLAAAASGILYLAMTSITAFISDALQPKYQRMVGLLCALTMAFSPTVWSRSVEAEVYALNACIVALVLWVAFQSFTGKLSGKVGLPLLGFLTGLAIASHITLGALASISILLAIYKRDDINIQTIVLSLMLGLMSLALYLYIPLRWPVVNDGERMSMNQFIRFVSNADSGGALHPRAFLDDPERWNLVFRLLRLQIGWVGLIMAVVGISRLFKMSWFLALGTFLSFGAWIWFNLSFYVAEPDYSAFLIPGYVVMTLWLGVGAAFTLEWLHRVWPGFVYIGIIILALLPTTQLWKTGHNLDTISLGSADESWGRYVLNLPIEKNAVILADSEKFPPLYYLQQIEGLRPDLSLVTLFNETQYRETLIRNVEQGKKVYVARYLPGLDEFGVSSLGPLVNVMPEIQPLHSASSDIIFGDILTLQDYALEPDPQGRSIHHLTLSWIPLDDINLDLEIRIRLKTQSGHIAWVDEPARPVSGYSSTSAWVKGIQIKDYYALKWPHWLPYNLYNLEIGLFPRFREQGLFVNGSSSDWISLTTQLLGSTQSSYSSQMRSMVPLQMLYGGNIWLLGIDLSGEISISSVTSVDLMFLCRDITENLITPHFTWVNGEEIEIIPPFYEQSTGEKTVGNLLCNQQLETRRFLVDTPNESGIYELKLGMHNSQRNILLGKCRWLGQNAQGCSVGQASVIPFDSGIANYNNTILLLDTELDLRGIHANGPLKVLMQWRGLRLMDKDFTMFLQVIGPDGKIYGQVDSWPQQGGRPTSGWLIGEEILDNYTIYIMEEAPPGQYEIIVGWYLLEDMKRIQVLNNLGQIVGDYFSLGVFQLSGEGDIN